MNTSTSCTPLASACVKTGPRFCTRIGSLPSKAGKRLGTTRTSHEPFGPYVSSAGGVASSLPGQNGQLPLGIGLDGELAGDEVAGAGGAAPPPR